MRAIEFYQAVMLVFPNGCIDLIVTPRPAGRRLKRHLEKKPVLPRRKPAIDDF
jgi:hypothetical protein